MGSAGVQARGLSEAIAAAERLPEAVTQALKGVARDTANRIAEKARTNLLSKTHGTGKTAASIRVLDESDRKQFDVNVPGSPDAWPNLPSALERGTRYMAARPYLRPAGDSESTRYQRDMAQAAGDIVTRLVK